MKKIETQERERGRHLIKSQFNCILFELRIKKERESEKG